MANKSAAKPNVPGPDWSKLETVIAKLEIGGPKLTQAQKDVIQGQRVINGLFYEAITFLLEQHSPSRTAEEKPKTRSLAEIKTSIQGVPGDGPPGCVDPMGPVR
jgi:hypothetical protein